MLLPFLSYFYLLRTSFQSESEKKLEVISGEYQLCRSQFVELLKEPHIEALKDCYDRLSCIICDLERLLPEQENTLYGKPSLNQLNQNARKLYYAVKLLFDIYNDTQLHELLSSSSLHHFEQQLKSLREMWKHLSYQFEKFVFILFSIITNTFSISFQQQACSLWAVTFLDRYGTKLSCVVPFDEVCHFLFTAFFLLIVSLSGLLSQNHSLTFIQQFDRAGFKWFSVNYSRQALLYLPNTLLPQLLQWEHPRQFLRVFSTSSLFSPPL